jgi:hypothetical protein
MTARVPKYVVNKGSRSQSCFSGIQQTGVIQLTRHRTHWEEYRGVVGRSSGVADEYIIAKSISA